MSSAPPVFMFAIRGLQALFAVIVFGLATSLIKGHHLGSLPSTLGFVAFVGGVSFVAALLGIAARWILVLQGKAGVLIDAVIACFNVAGGVLMAIKLKGVKCRAEEYHDNWAKHRNAEKLFGSDIICGGVTQEDGQSLCWWWHDKMDVNTMVSRCKMSQADLAFMFLTATVVIGAATLGYLRMKKGY